MLSSHRRAKARRSPLPRRSRNPSTTSPATRHAEEGSNDSSSSGEQIRDPAQGNGRARAAALPSIPPSPHALSPPTQNDNDDGDDAAPNLAKSSDANGTEPMSAGSNGNGHSRAPSSSVDGSHSSFPPPVHVGPPSGTPGPGPSSGSTPLHHPSRLQFSPLPIAAASLLSQSPYTPLRSQSAASPAPTPSAGSMSPFAGLAVRGSPVSPAMPQQVAAERLALLKRASPLAILPTHAVNSATNSRTSSRSGTRPATPLQSPRRAGAGALSISSLSLGAPDRQLSGSSLGTPNSAHGHAQTNGHSHTNANGHGNRSANTSTSPLARRQQHQHSASASFAYPFVSAHPSPPAAKPIPDSRPLPPPDLTPAMQTAHAQPAQEAVPAAAAPAVVGQPSVAEVLSMPPPAQPSPPATAALPSPPSPPPSHPAATVLSVLNGSSHNLSPPPLLTDQIVPTVPTWDGTAATEAPVPLHPPESAALTLDRSSQAAPSAPVATPAAAPALSARLPVPSAESATEVTLAPFVGPNSSLRVGAHDRISDLLGAQAETDAPPLSLSPMERELQLLAATDENDVPRVESTSSAPPNVDAHAGALIDTDAVAAIHALNDGPATDVSESGSTVRQPSAGAAGSADSSPLPALELSHPYLVVGGVLAVGVAVWWWHKKLEEKVRRALRR